MLMTELIEKKRDGAILSDGEIKWMITEYVQGRIPDYQMSAFLMATYFRGMTREETFALTMAMLHSGETLDLSSISGIKADKHSTGGVGDKISLILCPLVASLGIRMAKMSGRGLGFTGGTLDKLESFPGFSVELSREKFFENVENVGFAIAAQTSDLDPADKKLYALRDVTATVDSRPLIVSSIMSKKLAAGADIIVLDVKTGSGSFCKTEEEAFALARDMVDVGRAAGKKTVAVVTSMEEPLGSNVGNALEVREAISVLRGESGGNILEICLAIGSNILIEAGKAASEVEADGMLLALITSGNALCKLKEFVAAQNGNPDAVDDFSLLPQAPVVYELMSDTDGYVNSIRADDIGRICTQLGGGRTFKGQEIDLSVGVVLCRKSGDTVKKGECLAQIHARSMQEALSAAGRLRECFNIGAQPTPCAKLIRGIVR